MARKVGCQNTKKVVAAITNLPEYLHKFTIPEALREGGAILQAQMKATVPIDTGYLRKQIKKKMSGRKAGKRKMRVKVAASYVTEIEFGTSDQKPHPFVRPSFHSTKGTILAVFKAKLIEGVKAYRGR